jgi:hypothetical protein
MNLYAAIGSFLLLFLAVPVRSQESAPARFRISSNFEGGSAKLLAIDPETQTVRITPAGDSVRGMPIWWHFRLDGIDVKKPVNLEVVANEAIVITDVPGKTQRTPASFALPPKAHVSFDGKEWGHSSPGVRMGNQITYRLDSVAPTIWIAWGPPFTASDATVFVQRIEKEHSFARSFILCQSREGRQVPALRISEGNKPAAKRPAIWVQARQHAWECGSSWVATGFCEWLTSNNEKAKWLRQHAEIFIVPVMDIDHVATGDGGKNALPQDHNRDWTDTPHWNEVAAAQKHFLQLAKEKRLSVFLDLHNPGPGSRQLAIYVMNKEHIGAEAPALQEKFLELVTKQFGSFKRNVSKPPAVNPHIFYAVSDSWVAAHGNPNTIAFCIETPWNVPQGTISGYKATGEKVAEVVAAYLYP